MKFKAWRCFEGQWEGGRKHLTLDGTETRDLLLTLFQSPDGVRDKVLMFKWPSYALLIGFAKSRLLMFVASEKKNKTKNAKFWLLHKHTTRGQL